MTENKTKQVGNIAHPELGDVSIMEGITEKQIDQLIHYANTDEALKTTSDPRRFKDRASFDVWILKDRTIYTLTDITGELLGIIWFGLEELPEHIDLEYKKTYGVTFAIRIYGRARGKHLARSFMEQTFILYKHSEQFKTFSKKGIWLETPASNMPAVTAYQHFGFKQITQPDEKGRIIMILPLTFL